MKIVFPGINHVFECSNNQAVLSLVIENQKLLYTILQDIYSQLQGNDGKVVVSDENKILQTDKVLEMLEQFVPFEINRKQLINKVIYEISHIAMDDTHYAKTMELLSEIESYGMDLAFELVGDINFSKVGIEAILKAIGVEFTDEYTCLGEKIIDYFELVTEYERPKLFVLVNLRSFISDKEAEEFINAVLSRGYQILLIESSEHKLLEKEKRYIVDANLCEIG